MIERLVGECVRKSSSGIILDVHGVGYGVEITTTSLSQLNEGCRVVMWIYTHVSEDSMRLFGFLTSEERQLFALLLGVSRLGPKIALAIMSTFSVAQLINMIEQENAPLLAQVPGIGIQTAKKFLLELKPKIEKNLKLSWASRGEATPTTPMTKTSQHLLDLRSALQNLGYKDREFLPLVQKFEKEIKSGQMSEDSSLEDLLRTAMAELSRGNNTPSIPTSNPKDLELF